MKSTFLFMLAVSALMLVRPAGAAGCHSLDELRWLLGDWKADGATTSFQESWTEAGPQTFEGSGVERSNSDGALKGSEALRLVEMAGGVFYISKVTHNELPVAFRLGSCADARFVFENPAHDFPRRIEYRRETEDRLDVRVSDGEGKGFTLEFRRTAPQADATADVLKAEDTRFAAMIAADAVTMRRAFADDLEYVHSSGDVENREQLIASIISGRTRYAAVTDLDRHVVMLAPDAALVRGRGRFQLFAGAKPLDLQIRYLAAYDRTDGGWRLRAWQSLRQH